MKTTIAYLQYQMMMHDNRLKFLIRRAVTVCLHYRCIWKTCSHIRYTVNVEMVVEICPFPNICTAIFFTHPNLPALEPKYSTNPLWTGLFHSWTIHRKLQRTITVSIHKPHVKVVHNTSLGAKADHNRITVYKSRIRNQKRTLHAHLKAIEFIWQDSPTHELTTLYIAKCN